MPVCSTLRSPRTLLTHASRRLPRLLPARGQTEVQRLLGHHGLARHWRLDLRRRARDAEGMTSPLFCTRSDRLLATSFALASDEVDLSVHMQITLPYDMK